MPKYLAVYKCHLCGILTATTSDPIELSEDVAKEVVSRVIHNQVFVNHPILNNTPMHVLHNCSDGSIGLAQFAGLKKVDK